MLEWAIDWSGYGYTFDAPCVDCAVLTPNPNPAVLLDRVERGGGFMYPTTTYLAPTAFFSLNPSFRNINTGLRCARTP